MSWTALLVRFLLGGLLVYSGYEKLGAFGWFFNDVVLKMDLLGRSASAFVAAAVPGIEITAGVLLIAGFLVRGAAALSAALFSVFAAVLGRAILLDLPGTCGCFGPESDYPIDWRHVVMDLGLVLVSVFLVFVGGRRWSLDALRTKAGEARGSEGDGR